MRQPRILLLLISLFALVLGASAQDSKAETAKLAKLKAAYASAKANLAKKPTDPAKRKAFVSATVSYGTASMYSPILASKVKYRQALGLYREALKIDPKNKEALENKKTIEDIYKQMGRPIPPSP